MRSEYGDKPNGLSEEILALPSTPAKRDSFDKPIGLSTHRREDLRLNVLHYNRDAWNRQVEKGNRWTIPASEAEIAAARNGEWSIVLTPTKPVPHDWLPPLVGLRLLCLASGGGQQGPILAAAGASVVVFDNSPKQLAQDRFVAEREGLVLETVEGDMADLSCFPDANFDAIVHPCSNGFAPAIRPVWREAYRVLKPGGVLLAGFINPIYFLFDDAKMDGGIFEVRHRIPYSDLELSDAERQAYIDRDEPLSFGHTLEDQIAGQLDAGFTLAGFYEDAWPGHPLSAFISPFIATRAVKA